MFSCQMCAYMKHHIILFTRAKIIGDLISVLTAKKFHDVFEKQNI